jgi:hypothetical protein
MERDYLELATDSLLIRDELLGPTLWRQCAGFHELRKGFGHTISTSLLEVKPVEPFHSDSETHRRTDIHICPGSLTDDHRIENSAGGKDRPEDVRHIVESMMSVDYLKRIEGR